MKLTSAQIERTTDQFDAEPVPNDGRLVAELEEIFGDHTFFLAEDGLHIVEPAATQAGTPAGRIVKLARWADRDRKKLAVHRLEPTSVVINLDRAA